MSEAIKDDGLVIGAIGGSCPFQAEGMLDGKEFYFRSRGSHWAFNVGGDVVMSPEWTYEEPYGDGPFEAGWITDEEARAFIAKSVELYRNRDKAAVPEASEEPRP